MDTLDVTEVGTGNAVSIISAHVVAITDGLRFKAHGRVLMTNGGFFETNETREELLQLWDMVRQRRVR